MNRFSPRYLVLAVVAAGLLVAANFAIQPRRRAQRTRNCESNLKQIGLATLQYVRDYDEKYPLAASWADDLRPYAINSRTPGNLQTAFDKMFHCPTTRSFYVYNAHLATVSIETMTIENNLPLANVPLVTEAAAGQGRINLSGTGELWPTAPIHENAVSSGNHVLFADGHVGLTEIKPSFRAFAKPNPTPTPTLKPRVKTK